MGQGGYRWRPRGWCLREHHQQGLRGRVTSSPLRQSDHPPPPRDVDPRPPAQTPGLKGTKTRCRHRAINAQARKTANASPTWCLSIRRRSQRRGLPTAVAPDSGLTAPHSEPRPRGAEVHLQTPLRGPSARLNDQRGRGPHGPDGGQSRPRGHGCPQPHTGSFAPSGRVASRARICVNTAGPCPAPLGGRGR